MDISSLLTAYIMMEYTNSRRACICQGQRTRNGVQAGRATRSVHTVEHDKVAAGRAGAACQGGKWAVHQQGCRCCGTAGGRMAFRVESRKATIVRAGQSARFVSSSAVSRTESGQVIECCWYRQARLLQHDGGALDRQLNLARPAGRGKRARLYCAAAIVVSNHDQKAARKALAAYRLWMSSGGRPASAREMRRAMVAARRALHRRGAVKLHWVVVAAQPSCRPAGHQLRQSRQALAGRGKHR